MKIVRMKTLLLLVSATMPAFAQGQGLEAEIQALKTYCKPDIERLCPNVEPGGGRIKACLMAQKNELTVGCAKALQELKEIKNPSNQGQKLKGADGDSPFTFFND